MAARFIEKDALAFARAHVPEGPAQLDLEATFKALDPRFGEVMGLIASVVLAPGHVRRMRCNAVMLQFAAVQLADDLADGDCWYLGEPQRTGPGVQWLLQHLCQLALCEGEVDPTSLAEAARCLVRVGAAQQAEVRQKTWDMTATASAADGLNGQQYAAYLTWLWSGTGLQAQAREVGRAFGFCLHLASDRLSADRRWTDLSQEEQRQLIARARDSHNRLSQVLPESITAGLAWLCIDP